MPKPGAAGRGNSSPFACASASAKAGLCEFYEGARAMRERAAARRKPMLLFARHLAERSRRSIRQKHRVITEATLTARRPHQGAVDTRLERLHMPVRPRETERRDEMGAPIGFSPAAPFPQQTADFPHGPRQVALRPGPAARVRARAPPPGPPRRSRI